MVFLNPLRFSQLTLFDAKPSSLFFLLHSKITLTFSDKTQSPPLYRKPPPLLLLFHFLQFMFDNILKVLAVLWVRHTPALVSIVSTKHFQTVSHFPKSTSWS